MDGEGGRVSLPVLFHSGVRGLGIRDQVSGFRVQDSGFRVEGVERQVGASGRVAFGTLTHKETHPSQCLLEINDTHRRRVLQMV